MQYVTFQDAIEHVIDFLGGNPSQVAVRDSRRCILQAYRDLTNDRRWSYLMRHGRLVTNTPYSTGTIAYLQSSGALPYQVTLTGGTWPSWAAGGYLRVGLQSWRVATRASATVLTLDPQVNPGTDVTSTGYVLFQDTYLLPADFRDSDKFLYEQNFGGMSYVHPSEWLFENRYVYAQGIPVIYTIVGDQQYPGRLVVKMAPFPSELKTIDFLYHRRPRDLSLASYSTGKLAVTSGSQAVVGTGTSWTASMVGSVLRASPLPLIPPTSLVGPNPPSYEAVITGFTDATHITTDTPADQTYTAALYTIGDPVDVEAGAMMNAFYRGCEYQISIGRTMKNHKEIASAYQLGLLRAREADSRSFAGRRAGESHVIRQRLRDMPINLTEDSQ